MRVIKAEKMTAFIGDHLPDVAAWLAANPQVWKTRTSTNTAPSHEWDLGAGYAGALTMARQGWSEGAAQMQAGLRAAPAPNAGRRRLTYSVAGFRPCVGRAMSGAPDAMVARGKRMASAPIVEIVISPNASASVDGATIARLGVALCSVVQAIEASGRRVGLTVAWKAGLAGAVATDTIAAWRVKAPQDHLDLAAVAFSIAHPAANRRLAFAFCERLPLSTDSPSYGRTLSMEKADLELIGAGGAFAVNVKDSGFNQCTTPEAARAYVAGALNAAAGAEIVTAA